MNFEEARAQFPVLEKLAYLNAGTFGPIARTTHDAIVRELDRDYRDGRSGSPNFARVMELRDQLRRASPPSSAPSRRRLRSRRARPTAATSSSAGSGSARTTRS